MIQAEHGKCDMCGKDKNLRRAYYYYGIKCECHSPEHFEMVRHCGDCHPEPPKETTIRVKPRELER